jgi:hypothetical protein
VISFTFPYCIPWSFRLAFCWNWIWHFDVISRKTMHVHQIIMILCSVAIAINDIRDSYASDPGSWSRWSFLKESYTENIIGIWSCCSAGHIIQDGYDLQCDNTQSRALIEDLIDWFVSQSNLQEQCIQSSSSVWLGKRQPKRRCTTNRLFLFRARIFSHAAALNSSWSQWNSSGIPTEFLSVL